MSDADLRELERRFRASGSVEDEAAWLRARWQAGALEQSKLELAAYLGSAAAGTLLGDAGRHTSPPKTGVKGFVRKGLAPWGPVVLLRAAIAAARLVVSDDHDVPDEVGRVHIHLAEDYAVEPRQAVLDGLRGLRPFPRPQDERWHACWWACYGCMSTLAAQATGGTSPAWKAKDTAERVAEAVGSEATVRAAIASELLCWALGYRDPVRERVEARRARSG